MIGHDLLCFNRYFKIFRFLAQQVMQIIGNFTSQHFAPIAWTCHINSISLSLDKRKISIILKKEVCSFPCHLKETVPSADYYGFSWAIPFAIGPLLAGLVIDFYDPNWVWYAGGIFGLISAAMLGLMSIRSSRKEALAATAD